METKNKIKVLDACKRVIKENPDNNIGETLFYNMGLNGYCEMNESIWEQKRFLGYHVYSIYDTDSIVGLQAWFLDDEFVAYSHSTSRKGDTTWKWLDKEKFHSVKVFIEEFVEFDEDEIELIDSDDEIEEFFQLRYSSEGIANRNDCAFIKDGMVKIKGFDIPRNKDGSVYPRPKGVDNETIVVTFEDGTTKWMKMIDLIFRIRIK